MPISNSSNNFSRFNPNPRLNPNPKINHVRQQQIGEHAVKPHFRTDNLPPPRIAPPSTAEFNRRVVSGNAAKEAFYREYVSFDLASFSRSELEQLKMRLISELERVRCLLNRIENPRIESVPGFRGPPQPMPLLRKAELHHPPGKTKNQGKKKKFSGQKRSNLNVVSSGRDSKRPAASAIEVEDLPLDKLMDGMMKNCKQMLGKLMKHKGTVWFREPVDVERYQLFDYYNVIKKPMDLGTVKSKLEKNGYETPLAFAADVRLTFNNAMLYNPKGLEVHVMAEKLLLAFNRMFDPAFKKFEAEYCSIVANDVDEEHVNVNQIRPEKPEPKVMPSALPEPLPAKSNSHQMNMPPALVNSSGVELAGVASSRPNDMEMPGAWKLPKPKASDPNKRPMTYEEKTNLGANMQDLPPEKAEQMVHILRKRNPYLMQEGDEIELDIESLDNETLWELERFVSHHKRAMSKMMKQVLIQNAGSAEDVNKALANEAPLDGELEKNRKGEIGEDDVDIGEEIPVGNFPPVEIVKEATGGNGGSSSADSSSDSSSSSGSGSSSGSDSEADSVQYPFVESREAHGA